MLGEKRCPVEEHLERGSYGGMETMVGEMYRDLAGSG